MIHEYRTGRSVCGFVEFGAWLGVIASVIMIITALATATRGGGYEFALAGLVPALLVLIFSFILVVLVQMARATMDGSVAAQKNVIQSNKQHEEMMRALRSYSSRAPAHNAFSPELKPSLADAVPYDGDRPSMTGFETPVDTYQDDLAPALKVTAIGPDQLEYKGQTIHKDDGKFRVGELRFADLDRAKKHIERVELEETEREMNEKAEAVRSKWGY